MKTVYMFLFCLPTFAFCQGETQRIVPVCHILTLKPTGTVFTARGVGMFKNGELTLADLTCEVGGESDSKAILARFPAEAARQLRQRLDVVTGRPGPYFSLFQVVVQGRVTCREVNKRKGEVSGAGYGPYGRIPCEMTVTSIGQIHELR
jgi:hypothetical protein